MMGIRLDLSAGTFSHVAAHLAINSLVTNTLKWP